MFLIKLICTCYQTLFVNRRSEWNRDSCAYVNIVFFVYLIRISLCFFSILQKTLKMNYRLCLLSSLLECSFESSNNEYTYVISHVPSFVSFSRAFPTKLALFLKSVFLVKSILQIHLLALLEF